MSAATPHCRGRCKCGAICTREPDHGGIMFELPGGLVRWHECIGKPKREKR